MKKISLILAIFLGGITLSHAQFSSDPAQNLKLSSNGSENIVRTTPSGNVYVSTMLWEGGDRQTRGAHIKLYKLDKFGKTAAGWDSNGIYVAKQRTSTYSTGYGMIVLPDESVVIIHSDSRHDGDTGRNYFQPYVYKISKDAELEWGPNGSPAFTDATRTQGQKPGVFLTNSGEVIATWNDIYYTKVDTTLVSNSRATFVRINRNGEPAFDPIDAANSALFVTGTASGSSDFILTYKNSSTSIIYTKRYTKDGNLVWTSDKLSNEGIMIGNPILIESDGQDGALVSFMSSSGSSHHAMLQRVDKDGNLAMGLNGIQVGKGYKDQNGNPVLVVDKNRKAAYVSYVDKAAGSMAQRVFVAKLDYEGNYLFGDTVILLTGDPITGVDNSGLAVTDKGGIIGVYAKDAAAGGYTSKVYAYSIDSIGNMLWGNDTVLVSTRTGLKEGFSVSEYHAGQIVVAWDIKDQGVFVQNVNLYGELYTGIQSIPVNNIASFKTYPNPAHGKLNIEVSLTKPQSVSIDIFDTFGRKVTNITENQTINGTRTFEWNTTSVNKGIYFVTVYSGQSKNVSKVIVQ